jgi:hypothetical protein
MKECLLSKEIMRVRTCSSNESEWDESELSIAVLQRLSARV